MRRMRLTTAFVALSVAIAGGLIRSEAQPQAVPAHDYPVQPVPFTAVQVTDQFWAPRIEINRTVTIPVRVRQERGDGTRRQFRARRGGAAGPSAGRPQAARLSVRRHRHLQGARGRQLHAERQAGSEALRLSRRPDRDDRRGTGEGRLPVHDAHDRSRCIRTSGPGQERWVNEKIDSHELYNLGHLYEAAVAHYQATGEALAARRRAAHGRTC